MPNTAEDNVDLYCLECGYNLRGLSGDPRRCPECGYLNPVGELGLTAEAVSRQLRGFENAPMLCVVSMLCAAPAILMVIWLKRGLWFRGGGGSAEACVVVSSVAAVVGWIVGTAKFYEFSLGKAGWIAALFKYHIYALMMIAVVVAAYVGWQGLIGMMFGPLSVRPIPVLHSLLMLAFTAGVIVAIRWVLPRLHRRFRGDTLFLRREITIAIARNQIRNQMRCGPR